MRTFFFSILLFFFILSLTFLYFAKDLPRPEVFEERHLAQPTRIFARDGKTVLYTIFGEEKREPIELKDLPDYLIKAVLAAEDAKFFKHYGLDFKGIFRSVLKNLKLRKPIYGGSTISQQLIRSTFLTREKTIRRKIREIVLTLELERRYSKEQILEWYLNQIPFGPNLYGVEVASQNFFGKSAKDVTLPEAAVLASVIRAPSYYYPFSDHREELLKRKNYVLKRMLEEGFISEKNYKEAKEKEIEFKKTPTKILAPHFVFYVRNYLYKKYGEEFLKENGLRVYTTLDWDFQKKLEEIVKEEARRIKKYNAHNISVVAINPNTGEILAMIGSKDYFQDPYPEGCIPGKNCLFEPKVNVAIYGIGQQPGSAFKPFVYATAFQKGYSENTKVLDELTNFGKWGGKYYIPQNYDGKFRGWITLKQALAQSLNVPSVKVLLYFAGIEDSVKTAKKFGITTLNKPPSFYGPSLVLGGDEVRLLDITSAYGVFATEGLRNSPVAILKIEDSKGRIVEEYKPSPLRVERKDVCQKINDILSDNDARSPMFGRNSPLYFKDRWVAAKTGTTNSFRDAWTIGYTKNIVIGVWVGNNNNVPMKKVPAVTIAGPIWRKAMEEAIKRWP
ncbi:MAG: PBP1A family penicillin-binding protein [Candidatus Pacebacteria bacterium]|nr:PBP1A family penicillin-binding protein [Candidatus Paceibacterota bacterium]